MSPALCLGLMSGTRVHTRACTHTFTCRLTALPAGFLAPQLGNPWAGERAAGRVSTAQLLSRECSLQEPAGFRSVSMLGLNKNQAQVKSHTKQKQTQTQAD